MRGHDLANPDNENCRLAGTSLTFVCWPQLSGCVTRRRKTSMCVARRLRRFRVSGFRAWTRCRRAGRGTPPPARDSGSTGDLSPPKPKRLEPRSYASCLHGAAVAADGDRHEDEQDAGDPGEALNDVGGRGGSEGERARGGGGDRDWLVFRERLEPAGHRRDGDECR